MKNFGLIILSTYSTILTNFVIFRKVEWRSLSTYRFSILETKDTWLNKFLLSMLCKYKHISATKKERIYFYYSKKICSLMMILAIPWFILIYFMGWYENNIFLRWNFYLSFIICLLPTLILNFMMTIYAIKEALYNKKHTKINNIDPLKSDIKKLNARKIIKQQKETLDFLKQYGLRTTKHKHNRYSIAAADVKRVEEDLLKEFPKLYVISTEKPKGTLLLEIYNKQYDFLLIQVEISNR